MTAEKDKQSKPISRRQALKLLTAVSGAMTLANLPGKWSKPLLKVGVLPVHAQISQPTATSTTAPPANTATPTTTPTPTGTATPTSTPTATPTPALIQGLITAQVDWSAEVGELDLDLEVFDPGDGMWATPGNLMTLTLLHGGDSPLGPSGSETVNSPGLVAVGTYQIRLQVIDTNSSQGFLLFADIMITTSTTPTETRSIQFTDPAPPNGTIIDVATVDFPSGAINWLIP